MLLPALALCALPAPAPLRVLFLGNSHTHLNDFPAMVRRLAESDGSGRTLRTELKVAPFLPDFWAAEGVRNAVADGRWHAVVMQGARLSSSHRRQYSHDDAIKLAKLAERSGARALLFAEWPRKGWKETAYILDQYRMISRPSGAEIIPVPLCFDAVLLRHPELDPWADDGNHAKPLGTYIAAATAYYALFGGGAGRPTWRPPEVPADLARDVLAIARRTVASWRG